MKILRGPGFSHPQEPAESAIREAFLRSSEIDERDAQLFAIRSQKARILSLTG